MIALLLALAGVGQTERPPLPLSAAQLELARFDTATAAESFIDKTSGQLFAEVDARFAKANPGEQMRLAPIIARARSEYRAIILSVGPMMADSYIRNRSRDESGKLASLAIRYSTTARAKSLIAQMTSDTVLCLDDLGERAECGKITRTLASVRADGVDGSAFATVLSASRLGLVAAMQLGLDSGDVRTLVKRSDIEAAGLKWPE